MYTHIGKDYIIKSDNIIAILNLEKIDKNNKEILKNMNIKNNIVDISKNNNKSLIIFEEEKVLKGYITNISSTTLAKRIQKELI